MSSSPVFLLTLNRNIWDGSLAVEKTISKGNQTVSIVSNITVTFTHSRIVWIVKKNLGCQDNFLRLNGNKICAPVSPSPWFIRNLD